MSTFPETKLAFEFTMSPDLVVLARPLNDTASLTDLLDALIAHAGAGEELRLPSARRPDKMRRTVKKGGRPV
jgi:hypothetical protein